MFGKFIGFTPKLCKGMLPLSNLKWICIRLIYFLLKVHHGISIKPKFVVTDDDVDAIIKLWLKERHGPLAKPLPDK